MFRDVDVSLFAHVGANLASAGAADSGTRLVSVEYFVQGQSAHAAAAPWRGRSALDAVEPMDVAGISAASTCVCSSDRTT